MIGHWEIRGFGRFVFIDSSTGHPIGHVGALQLDANGTPELTWTIWSGNDEGQGFAFEASRFYQLHAARVLGFSSMLARINPGNQASIKLAQKLGGCENSLAPPPPWFPDAITFDFDLRKATN